MPNENETPEVEENENETPEVDESGLLDAISDGIDEVSPHIEDNDDDESESDDDPEGTEGESEQEGETDTNESDDEPAAGSGTEDGAGDGDDTPDSDEGDDDSDGAGEGEGEGSTGEGSDESQAADESDSAAEPDHINDPIAEGTNEKTAARIEGLIKIAKEQTTRAEQGDEIVAAITDAGADPEQFTNTLGFLSLYNSKDPANRKAALEVARGVVRELSIELGEGTADLLANHDDLRADIEDGNLTEKRAIEIATARESQALQTSRTEHQQQKDKDVAEGERLMNLGKDQLTAFETTAKTDPAYEPLYPTFRGLLADALKGGKVHPEQWGETAQRIFDRLKANYTPAPQPETPAPNTPQPRRAKQGAGGGGSGKKPEPQSAVEALDDALGTL